MRGLSFWKAGSARTRAWADEGKELRVNMRIVDGSILKFLKLCLLVEDEIDARDKIVLLVLYTIPLHQLPRTGITIKSRVWGCIKPIPAMRDRIECRFSDRLPIARLLNLVA